MDGMVVYDIVFNVFGLAIACFSLGYAFGKDRSNKK